ncbi:MAG: PfkB family carbohydrate kinase [Bacteroidales bacterium]
MIPKFTNNKVLCIGEILWDNLSGRSMPGGALLNMAYHFHNNNLPVTLVSKVGPDTRGIELLGYMKKTGLNTDAIYFDDSLSTSEVDVNIDRFKNIRYNIGEPVAWDNLKINMKIVDCAGTAGAIVYGSLASRNKVTRETINVLLNFDIVKIMNVNLRPPYDKKEIVEPLLMKADIVKLNENELDKILGWHNKVFSNQKDQLKWFLEYYKCEIICLFKEKNGASVFYDGILLTHPGYKIETTDRVGTGAAFLAGFISSLIAHKTIYQSLDVACATAALIASSEGSISDYNLQDINSFNANILNK